MTIQTFIGKVMFWLFNMLSRLIIAHLRSGEAAKRSNPKSKEQWLCGCRRAKRSYSTFKVRRGNLVQGKEQQLRFAGAAMKLKDAYSLEGKL